MGTQIPMEWELIGASSGNEFGNRNHDAVMGMANFFCARKFTVYRQLTG